MNAFTSPNDDLGNMTYEKFAAAKALFDNLLIPVRYIPSQHMLETDEWGQPTAFWSKSHEVLIIHPNSVKWFDDYLRQRGMRLLIVDSEWYLNVLRMKTFQPIQLEIPRG